MSGSLKLGPFYPLQNRLDGFQSWSGHSGGEGKNLCTCQEPNPGRPLHSLLTTLTKLTTLDLRRRAQNEPEKLHNEELYNNDIEVDQMGEACSRRGRYKKCTHRFSRKN